MAVSVYYPALAREYKIDRNWTINQKDPRDAWKRPYYVQPATCDSISQCLNHGGPFVAMAAIGPAFYRDEPRAFTNQIPGHDDVTIYGWPKGSPRKEANTAYVIICGVQRREGIENVYFRIAKDVSPDPSRAIGTIQLTTDQKVYGTAVATFAETEFDMFPPVSPERAQNQEKRLVPTIVARNPGLMGLWQTGAVTITTPDNAGNLVPLAAPAPASTGTEPVTGVPLSER